MPSAATIEARDLTLVRDVPGPLATRFASHAGRCLRSRTTGSGPFADNLAGLPLAAAGWLNPVFAGAALAFSSSS